MIDDLVQLSVVPKRLSNPLKRIENLADGRSVLNIGAAGGVTGYLPANKGLWLHERMKLKARKLVGIDIDTDAIRHAKSYGYDIWHENCETMNLRERFDLIVMSDVIEHVNAPVFAIENIVNNHLSDCGSLIITTPNATAGNILIRTLFGKNINVLGDHVTTYYPEHFQAICNRLELSLTNIYFFDNVDRRTAINRFKSQLFQIMTFLSPRLASSMLIEIKNKRL